MRSKAEVQVRYSAVSLYALLFLFFFQLLTVFVETIYAFGLLGTGLTPEVAAVLLMLSPFLWVLLPGPPGRRLLMGLLGLFLLCRATAPSLPPQGKLFVSGLGVAAFLAYLPGRLSRIPPSASSVVGFTKGSGLTLALMLSILLRAINSGVDPSIDGPFRWTGWVLVLAAAALAAGSPAIVALDQPGEPHLGKGKSSIAAAPGILGVFAIVYFALAAPNVVARWTATEFPWIVAALGFSLAVCALLLFAGSQRLRLLGKGPHLIWNAVLVLALTMTIRLHQVSFPAAEASYPLVATWPPPLSWVVLGAFLLSSPVFLLNFVAYLQTIIRSGESHRRLGVSFGLACVALLVLIFGHVFTTVYDYIPLVGPFFRDKFWMVHLAAGLLLALPAIRLRPNDELAWDSGIEISGGERLVAVIGLIAVAAFAGTLLRPGWQNPVRVQENRPLRVLTYNIQQGYSAQGVKNLDGQLELIRSLSPDVVGLQETDTNRVSGGNTDLVRYFADRLDMYAFYGPKTVDGTFGIALLSRVPIEEPRTIYLYSQAEQTAAIEAEVKFGDRTYRIVNTHLGNGGPMIQLENVLESLPDPEGLVVMGDFNFNPQSPQYRLATAELEDAWLLGGSPPLGGDGFDPARRIDHVFISSDLEVAEAHYILSPASDHPALFVEFSAAP